MLCVVLEGSVEGEDTVNEEFLRSWDWRSRKTGKHIANIELVGRNNF